MPYPYQGLTALYRLDYGPRDEFSVALVPKDFSTLSELFARPGAFLSDVVATHVPTSVGNWRFASPITIVAKPLTAGAYHVSPGPVTLAVIDLATALGLFDEGRSLSDYAAKANMAPDLLQRIEGQLAGQGAYIAEFALRTHLMHVWYIAPSKPPPELFMGNLFPPNYTGVPDPAFGMLHFDVDLTNANIVTAAYARAALAFDYIVNPQYLTNRLNKLELFEAENIKVIAPAQVRLPGTMPTRMTGFTFKADPGQTVVLESVLPNPFPEMPAGDDFFSYVCGTTPTIPPPKSETADGQVVLLTDLTLKGYQKP